jgi:hypothetical protein
MNLRRVANKILAGASLFALLTASVPGLAESMSASSLPACCNTAYCPVHHRQMSNLQKDKANCDAMGVPGQNNCSMRSCDAAPNPIIGSVTFVLVTLVGFRGPAVAGDAPAFTAQHFPLAFTIPITPPPRTFLS